MVEVSKIGISIVKASKNTAFNLLFYNKFLPICTDFYSFVPNIPIFAINNSTVKGSFLPILLAVKMSIVQILIFS